MPMSTPISLTKLDAEESIGVTTVEDQHFHTPPILVHGLMDIPEISTLKSDVGINIETANQIYVLPPRQNCGNPLTGPLQRECIYSSVVTGILCISERYGGN